MDKKLYLCRTTSLSWVSVLFLGISAAQPVLANPQGGDIAAGNATLNYTGSKLDIHQTTDRAVIDWRSFDIAPGEHTQFHQPSVSSTTLNRVKSADPSHIMGTLSANGNVVLVNPNGVFFGKNSRVDINSLITTTADIDNYAFMQGELHFNKPGNPNAAIINEGTITAKDAGLVGLVAPQVENRGIIETKLGKVHLASGDSMAIDLYGDGLFEVKVSDKVKSQLLSNTGTISANGGSIALTAAAGREIIDSLIEVEGELRAPAITEKGGKIIIGAATDMPKVKSAVKISGVVAANGRKAGSAGGDITITGDNIALSGNAWIDASGKNGGGTVKIGGDYQGTGNTPTANKTYIGKNTTITVNANDTGNGGTAIIWADNQTEFHGNIHALGGNQSGDGGLVETSGKQMLSVTGQVYAGAPHGKAGQWLLDPNNITIQTGADGADSNITETPGPPNLFQSNADNAIVTTGSIESALNAGTDVTIQTAAGGIESGNITVNNAITKSAGGNATLRLNAHNNIAVNANITSTMGALNLILNADTDQATTPGGAISLTNAIITTLGGSFTAGGGANPLTTAARANEDGVFDHGVFLTDTQITTGIGNISIRGTGENTAANNSGIYINGGTNALTTTTGNITLNGTGGNGTSSNYGVRINNATINSDGGIIAITGTGGNGSAGSNSGISVAQSSITNTGGNITLTGTSNATNDTSNYGVLLSSLSTLKLDGTGPTAGTLKIDGTGGNGTNFNYGVYIVPTTAQVTAIDGAIEVIGKGGNGSSSTNHGIFVSTGADITSTGVGASAATLSFNGTGGNGSSSGYGVALSGNGTSIASEVGAISIIGKGGNSGDNNYGIYLSSGADIIAKAGTMTLNGTGGNGASSNYGVHIRDTGTSISSIDGNIAITGTGASGASGTGNDGIFLFDEADIISTNNANITLTGIKGVGAASDGLQLQQGTIDIGASGGDNMLGDITINADGLSILTGAFTTDGAITFKPVTPTTTIGISGGTGFLNFIDGVLARINPGTKLVIGDSLAGVGDIDLNSWDLGATNYDVELYGNDIDIGGVTMGGGNFLAHARDNGGDFGDLTLSAGITRNTNGAATLDLRADQNVLHTNNAGISAVDADSDGDGNPLTDADPLHIILNAERDSDNAGRIVLSNGTFSSNGGSITLGGGTNPLLNAAKGFRGIDFTNMNFNTGGGNFSAFGHSNSASGTVLQGIVARNTNINTAGGNITLEGISSPTGTSNQGILLRDNTTLQSSGNINIKGTSLQAGSRNFGVAFINGVTVSGNGSLNITGISPVEDFYTELGTVYGGPAATGTFTLNVNDVAIEGNIQTSGSLIFRPRTATTEIGVGIGTTAGGAGLEIDVTELALLNAGSYVFGDSNTGAMKIGGISLNANQSYYGSTIDVVGNVDAATNTLLLDAATGDIIRTAGTLSAASLNMDAATTIIADINATNVNINNNATGATLTGLVNGGADQIAANLILGGPGNDPAYTFEGFIIRQPISGGGGVIPPVVSMPEPTPPQPEVPETEIPVMPAEPTMPGPVPVNNTMTNIPHTVEIISQNPAMMNQNTYIGQTTYILIKDNFSNDSEENEDSHTSKKKQFRLKQLLEGLVSVHEDLIRFFRLMTS